MVAIVSDGKGGDNCFTCAVISGHRHVINRHLIVEILYGNRCCYAIVTSVCFISSIRPVDSCLDRSASGRISYIKCECQVCQSIGSEIHVLCRHELSVVIKLYGDIIISISAIPTINSHRNSYFSIAIRRNIRNGEIRD